MPPAAASAPGRGWLRGPAGDFGRDRADEGTGCPGDGAEGAVSLSTAFTGGGYKYADEMIAMAKVVAGYGGYYGTHIGGEGEQINEELDKAIRIAEETGIPVHIYHIKVRGKNNFGKVKEVIKKIDAARARGLDITANQYP